MSSSLRFVGLSPVYVSWESLGFVSSEFEAHFTANVDAFKSALTTLLEEAEGEDEGALSAEDVSLWMGEGGTLPVSTEDASACDEGVDYSDFPAFSSRMVGSGNVVQIDFERATNFGGHHGNRYFKDLFLNYIADGSASDAMSYAATTFQDASTALFLIGYGVSTVSENSEYSVPDCIRDSCYALNVSCDNDANQGQNAEDGDWSEVMEARITGPSVVPLGCDLALSGTMSVGPLWKKSEELPGYPLYRWTGSIFVFFYQKFGSYKMIVFQSPKVRSSPNQKHFDCFLIFSEWIRTGHGIGEWQLGHIQRGAECIDCR